MLGSDCPGGRVEEGGGASESQSSPGTKGLCLFCALIHQVVATAISSRGVFRWWFCSRGTSLMSVAEHVTSSGAKC